MAVGCSAAQPVFDLVLVAESVVHQLAAVLSDLDRFAGGDLFARLKPCVELHQIVLLRIGLEATHGRQVCDPGDGVRIKSFIISPSGRLGIPGPVRSPHMAYKPRYRRRFLPVPLAHRQASAKRTAATPPPP